MRQCKYCFRNVNQFWVNFRFFVPSIINLRKKNRLFLISISNGGADGKGRVREKELEKSCQYLKFAEPPTVIDDQDLQDGMNTDWSSLLVAEQIKKYLKAKASDGDEINIIITFDKYGVSKHTNHIAVHNGVCEVIQDHSFDLELYTLITVNIFRKYISFFDISLCDSFEYHLFNWNLFESWNAMSLHNS